MALAGNPILDAKIKSVVPDPIRAGRTIVTIEFNDGKGEPWTQQFSIENPDRPLSLEEFLREIRAQEYVKIERPSDPFHYVRESIGKPLKVDLTPPEKKPDVEA